MGEEDLLLNTEDLMDIFGDSDKAGKEEDLGDLLEDILLSGRPAAPAAASTHAVTWDEPARPASVSAAQGAPKTPEEYEAFKRQVIERYERQKAEEERLKGEEERVRDEEKQKADLEESKHREQEAFERRKAEIIARYEAQKKAGDDKAQEEQARSEMEDKIKAEAEANQKKEKEEHDARMQAMVEKYKRAKEEETRKRAAALGTPPRAAQAAPAEDANLKEALASEKEKEDKFRDYLKNMKVKMAQGQAPPPRMAVMSSETPPESAAASGLRLDEARSKSLAAMFEDTRVELTRKVSDKIGVKPARTMMMKTVEKILKVHGAIYDKAAQDLRDGKIRADGALDVDRLARNFMVIPEAQRRQRVYRGLHDLLEMRFIAMELGLGVNVKGHVVSQVLGALEETFQRKGYPKDLVKWYMDDVVPSTVLADSDEGSY